MAEITITHSHAEGTLVEGMARGDGTYEIVCARGSGFRWFRSLGCAGIPQSRDHVAKRYVINQVADRLREAGHTVVVEIDDEHRPRAEVLADQADRLDDRREALEAKAARRRREADTLRASADAEIEHRPPGQPLLVDHYSYSRELNRQERHDAKMRRSFDAADAADEVARRAAVVGNHARAALDPRAALGRIERIEAKIRGIRRELDGHTRRFLNADGTVHSVETYRPVSEDSGRWQQLTARLAQLEDQLAYDRQLVDNAVAEGLTLYGPDTVQVGDLVTNRAEPWADWRRVVRVNKKTVTVETKYSWTDKIPFASIRGLRAGRGKASDA